MNIEGRKILVLGGYGLVGMAVCRELLARKPREIQIHSLTQAETEEARQMLLSEAGDATISTSHGDIFGPSATGSRDNELEAQLGQLQDENLPSYLLYQLLVDGRPDILIDCVNTATGIAYRDVYSAARTVLDERESGQLRDQSVTTLLEALYIPRLIRHIQILYRGMQDAATAVYLKVGTSGTGGMGLNVPYTHSEEKPSRVLLSKSAVAGAHSLLLFLMARTPEAPITKEIKPAAAIAWKKIGYGPIARRREPIFMVKPEARPLGDSFSTVDPEAGELTDDVLTTAYIDTGENGIFSLEEFAMLTTAEQMEFVTPEEIAQYLVFEIEGGNTGHDIINALDNAVLGPSYRAGMMRHWAMERMAELERQGETRSVAFEMLGPPRNTKLLFEAHLLREAFGTMVAVRDASPEDVAEALDKLVRNRPRIASEVISVGLPIILSSGEIMRSPKVIVPSNADDVALTPELVERWVRQGWVDLRVSNCRRWVERFRAIHNELTAIPEEDTSSRYLRNHRFWDENKGIQPGKLVGWILSGEEKGDRVKH
ncbi:MAG: short-chain dehydrogenase [bacterium]|nr:short-chain dehydrogenase [bacterium]